MELEERGSQAEIERNSLQEPKKGKTKKKRYRHALSDQAI